jgi:hypothetical protein
MMSDTMQLAAGWFIDWRCDSRQSGQGVGRDCDIKDLYILPTGIANPALAPSA